MSKQLQPPASGQPNGVPERKEHLSRAGTRLVELLSEINFGRIHNLEVRNGDPVLDPPPLVVREVKFASSSGPRPESRLPGFALKDQHVDLFRLLAVLGDGVISVLTIKHGLPFHAEVGDVASIDISRP
jgi:hypothetical protein